MSLTIENVIELVEKEFIASEINVGDNRCYVIDNETAGFSLLNSRTGETSEITLAARFCRDENDENVVEYDLDFDMESEMQGASFTTTSLCDIFTYLTCYANGILEV